MIASVGPQITTVPSFFEALYSCAIASLLLLLSCAALGLTTNKLTRSAATFTACFRSFIWAWLLIRVRRLAVPFKPFKVQRPLRLDRMAREKILQRDERTVAVPESHMLDVGHERQLAAGHQFGELSRRADRRAAAAIDVILCTAKDQGRHF